MLIVLSDLHFSDGSTATNVAPEVFSQILFPAIMLRAGNPAKSLTEIHLVLAGDIFDLVRADKWLELDKAKRPWNGTLDFHIAVNTDFAVELLYSQVLDIILAEPACATFIAEINKLADNIHGIPVKITYLPGNHDRAVNNYVSLQNKIRSLFPGIDIEIRNNLLAGEYAVLCRHGHEWDETCYSYDFARKVLNISLEDRFDPAYHKVQNIGEVITTEILGGITYHLKNTFNWQGKNDKLLEYIKDIYNVRPALSGINWLIWITTANFDKTLRSEIINALHLSLESFLDTTLAKMWDKVSPDLIFIGDIIDRIQLLKNYLMKDNFNSLQLTLEIIKFGEKYFKPFDDKYVKGARQDFEKHPDIQLVIYGHTHQAREVIIAGNSRSTYRYINTGTYLPLIQEARVKGFGRAKRMTLTFIYNKNEDRGSNSNKKENSISLEFWDGLKQKEYQ
ncbi:MAG: hypothetical protein K9N06_06575 [Candidatus Cloacimonetes bacterium]|nr:hypothetical protein [Candidatus Cloacimonadota bacterium]